jgi:stage III sporulation protein SpoIIIAA
VASRIRVTHPTTTFSEAGPHRLADAQWGSVQEARSVRSIACRGVMVVATAHGISLQGLLHNPDLCALVRFLLYLAR